MEKYTIMTGSLKELEGNKELLDVVEDSILDKIPQGYELEQSSYEYNFTDRNSSELDYKFKVVSKQTK
ncbi:hypothetical protein [Staphylococcus phage SpP]